MSRTLSNKKKGELFINGENRRIAPQLGNHKFSQLDIVDAHLNSNVDSVDYYAQIAIDILNSKGITETIMVYYDNYLKKYVVQEGNRRIVGLYLIENPKLAGLWSGEIENHPNKIDLKNLEIPTLVFDSKEDCIIAANKTNPTKKNGAHKKGWDTLMDIYHNDDEKPLNILLRFILDKCGITTKQMISNGFSGEAFKTLFTSNFIQNIGIKLIKDNIEISQKVHIQSIMRELFKIGMSVPLARKKSFLLEELNNQDKIDKQKINIKSIEKSKKINTKNIIFYTRDIKKISKNTKAYDFAEQLVKNYLKEDNYLIIGAAIRGFIEILVEEYKCYDKSAADTWSKIEVTFKLINTGKKKKLSNTSKVDLASLRNTYDYMQSFLHSSSTRLDYGEAVKHIRRYVDFAKQVMLNF